MTLNKLCSLIAKAEGKKSQTKIGDVREVMRIFLDMLSGEEYGEEVVDLLNIETEKRSKKK